MFGHNRQESGLEQAQGGLVTSEGGVGPDLGRVSDSDAVMGVGHRASRRPWALMYGWQVAGLLSPRPPGWL